MNNIKYNIVKVILFIFTIILVYIIVELVREYVEVYNYP